MKMTIQLFTTLVCLALASPSVHAALSYWDSNGPDPGAGDTPNGTWDTDLFWNVSSGGTGATNTWGDGDTAVFSAGSDATNAFTVTVGGTVNVSGITFQEGTPTVTGGTINMTNEFDFPIVANTDATIASVLTGSFATTGFKKTGASKLTLSGNSSYSGTNTVAEGIVAIGSPFALGLNSGSPTVVSNGATLQQAAALDFTVPVILYGSGVNNTGALYASSVDGAGTHGWHGGATLGSDSRINITAGGQWTWLGGQIVATNGGGNFNLSFGGTGTGTIRLNINANPSVRLGSGAIYKDGASRLQFETPAGCSALYFNGGSIVNRVSGGFMTGTNIIYVGANAVEFRTGTGGPSYTLPNPMVLAAGANPFFDPLTAALVITCSGPISGSGGLGKSGPGVLALNGTNTYTGNTTISAGTVTVGANGSISSSAVIDVQTGTTLDVSAKSGGFVLGPSQTIKGNGTVVGNAAAAGTISPGASIGNLTFSNNLALAAGVTLSIEVDKAALPSSDLITVLGTATNAGAGTVAVTNIGATALAPGDSFQIFSQPVLNGQALCVVGGGVAWNNKLAVDGTIVALSAAAPATNVSIVRLSPTSVQLGGKGAANTCYGVFAATNLVPPVSWTIIGSTNSDAGGIIQFVDPQAGGARRFYRFGQ
jgi:autotransporter-associated beta strand protein